MKESLAQWCPRQGREELLAQWHPEKNQGLSPGDVSHGSKKKIWWRCDKGHEWQAVLFSRSSQGKGCPVCSGKKVQPGVNDLASFRPELARQWHPEKNAPLTAQQVTPSSNRRVWWQCDKGHAWQAAVASRSRDGSGCPFCSGRQVLPGFNDLATLFPSIAAEWDEALNGSLSPAMVTAGSARKVWWRCASGHVWKAVISSRTGKRKHACPVCAGKTKTIRYRERTPSLSARD